MKADSKSSEAQKPDVIPLKNIPVVEMRNACNDEQENIAYKEDQRTPVVPIRRSSRTIRPPQRYSPVLHYILLTEKGESKGYDEAM